MEVNIVNKKSKPVSIEVGNAIVIDDNLDCSVRLIVEFDGKFIALDPEDGYIVASFDSLEDLNDYYCKIGVRKIGKITSLTIEEK